MKDLRPISLCNVIYKIVSKVLCNRMKSVLPGLVNLAQSAFVAGRSIQDNILIAFEVIHMMKNKRRGKSGDVALKIDISKAYDKVDWRYLKLILYKLGFSEQGVKWMLMCVESVTYFFQVNESFVGPIIPGRGLRQGDPLSPYLFILCAEGLSAAIDHATGAGILHESKVCRTAPPISHLMFADDCLLFCKATKAECTHLRQLLADYERVSGQAVNFSKLGVYFSKNVNADTRRELSSILGVHSPLNTCRYLGLPSLVGREKNQIFKYIKDRLWKKLQGWHGRSWLP